MPRSVRVLVAVAVVLNVLVAGVFVATLTAPQVVAAAALALAPLGLLAARRMGTAFRLGAALLAAVYAAIGLYMALAFLPLTWPSAFVLLVASIVPAPTRAAT